MDSRHFFLNPVYICFILFAACLLLTGCGTSATASTVATITPTLPEAIIPPATFPATAILPKPTQTPICTDNLTFIEDVTIPDNTLVAPGSILDKQWRVQNTGDCNWDVQYRLRLIYGEPLGAVTDQALYPARVGTQVILRILFTAPQETGDYISEWQAFDANGIPFGESFFMKISVQP